MIIFLHRRTLWGICMVAAGFALLLGSVAMLTKPDLGASSAVKLQSTSPTVIWDAGHGGADGGAVSAAGIPEDDINLSIAKKCYQLSGFFGVPATMTRWDEGSLADSQGGIRQQKVSDTQNRVALVNSFDSAVLLSIHQNSLPDSPGTHGAMVFYNGVSPADVMGQCLQNALNETANRGNEKKSRPISESIYLMSHASCPAVLVECGFLSNPDEAALLQEPTYQTKLACTMLCGYLQYRG